MSHYQCCQFSDWPEAENLNCQIGNYIHLIICKFLKWPFWIHALILVLIYLGHEVLLSNSFYFSSFFYQHKNTKLELKHTWLRTPKQLWVFFFLFLSLPIGSQWCFALSMHCPSVWAEYDECRYLSFWRDFLVSCSRTVYVSPIFLKSPECIFLPRH